MEQRILFTCGQSKYWVYRDGKIWSWQRQRYMRTRLDKDGYVVIELAGQIFRVHRLVLTCFDRPALPGEITRHLDGDRTNNNFG